VEVTISLKSIDSWDVGVSVGTDLKEHLDQTHLNLGILANHLCPVRKAGRQSKENKSQTISALADAIGIDRAWLSNAAGNAEFFVDHYEEIPPQASIGMLSRARKLTTWKTGQPVTKKAMAKALKYLAGKVDEPMKIPPAAIAYVRSARAKLAKALEHEKPLGDVDKALVEKAKDKLDQVDANNPEEEIPFEGDD